HGLRVAQRPGAVRRGDGSGDPGPAPDAAAAGSAQLAAVGPRGAGRRGPPGAGQGPRPALPHLRRVRRGGPGPPRARAAPPPRGRRPPATTRPPRPPQVSRVPPPGPPPAPAATPAGCPSGGHVLRLSALAVGKKVRCPVCQAAFVVPASSPDAPAAAPSPASTATTPPGKAPTVTAGPGKKPRGSRRDEALLVDRPNRHKQALLFGLAGPARPLP